MECSSTSTDDDSDRSAPAIARVREGGGKGGERVGGLKCAQEEARSRESRSESYKEPG